MGLFLTARGQGRGCLRRQAMGGVALSALALCWAVSAVAEPVSVTFAPVLADGSQPGLDVSWSATPLDLPPDADVLAALVFTPEPRAGNWQVALDPGLYQISGFTEQEIFEATVTIAPDGPHLFEVPVVPVEDSVVFRCPTGPACAWADPDTGLSLTVPPGWAVDRPYHADLGEGETAEDISAVFFEDVDGDGASVWFLNPVDWIDDDNGPCRDVSLGVLCTFEVTPGAEAAFALIAPSLAARAGAAD